MDKMAAEAGRRIIEAEQALYDLTRALRSLPAETQVAVCQQMVAYLNKQGLLDGEMH